LEALLNTVVESAARVCEAERGLILRPTGKNASYYAAASYGHTTEYVEHHKTLSFAPGRGGVSGRVLLEGKSVQIADVLTDPEWAYPEIARLGNFRTILGVPLLREGIPIGIFLLHRTAIRPFTERQIRVVETFADQAVIAIENTRLFETEQQRTRELSESLEQQTATAEVLGVINSSPGDLAPVFDAMLKRATQLCGAGFGTLWTYDGERFSAAATHAVPAAFAEFVREPLPLAASASFVDLVGGQDLVHLPDLAASELYRAGNPIRRAIVDLGGARTMISVALRKDNALLGVFNVYRQEVRPFSDKQIELVKNFAAQAVVAIENTRLLNELRQRTEDLSHRTADLTESLDQQTATAKVLEVISRSAFDLHAIFDTVAESAVRLCGADRAIIYRFDGEMLRMAVAYNVPPEFKEFIEQNPFRPGRHNCTGRAALERGTIHIPDILADPEYTYGARAFFPTESATVLGVPILKGDDLLGVITIYHERVRPFTDKQIALVETFADQSAIAIENVRLLDELRQRTNELGRSVGELRALGEVSQAVNSTLDLETVLSTIVANAVQLSGTEAGAIYVFNNTQREFRLRATYGMDRELIEALTQRHIGLDEPNITPAFLAGEPIQVPDLREAVSSAVNDIVLRAGFRALLIAPLLRAEEIVGMLVVRRRAPGSFPQNTVDLIKTFAAQSAVAIENARLFQNVQTSLEDLRTTQDRLVQTQKLASLGQLTAGIAHEIKNPLNFVNNFSGVSVEMIDELRETLEGINVAPEARATIDRYPTRQSRQDRPARQTRRLHRQEHAATLARRFGRAPACRYQCPRRGSGQSCLSRRSGRETRVQRHARTIFGPRCWRS
jgi:two-component system, NtrC family, sensor kinase